MPPITHQAIADRIAETCAEEAAARRKVGVPFERERASLQESCGGLGHIFTRGDSILQQSMGGRRCAICGAKEP